MEKEEKEEDERKGKCVGVKMEQRERARGMGNLQVIVRFLFQQMFRKCEMQKKKKK